MFPFPISNVFLFFFRIEGTGRGHHNARNDQPTSASPKKKTSTLGSMVGALRQHHSLRPLKEYR